MSYPTQSSLLSPLQRQRHWPLFYCLLAATIAGCGTGAPTNEELAVWIGKQNATAASTIDAIEITDTQKQADGTIRIRLTVSEELQRDVFEPVTLAEAFTQYGYDTKPFEAALQNLPLLREPEQSVAAASRPAAPVPADIFRLTGSIGDKTSWEASVNAVETDGTWQFSGLQGQIDPQIINSRTVSRNDLPEGAVSLEPSVSENAVTQLIAQQKAFNAAVEKAGIAVRQRLDREQQLLLRAIQSSEPFVFSLPTPNGPVQKIRIRFVHQKNDGEAVFALLEDVEDEMNRATWQGSLTLAPPPQPAGSSLTGSLTARPLPDGWSVMLSPVSGAPVFPRVGSRPQLVLGVTADNQLAWLNADRPVLLEGVPDSNPLPEYSSYQKRIEDWTAPGQMWEGTIQYQGDVSHKVRVTFTEVLDAGNYVRAILETPTDNYAVAVLEGTVTTSPAGIYSWPVNLKWSSGDGTRFKGTAHEIPLISHGGELSLAFSADGRCFGGSQSANSLSRDIAFHLQSAGAVANFQPASKRWHNALQPGFRWSGQIVRGDQPADKIALTICHINEDGRSFQIAAENPDNPHQFRVFAATLHNESRVADGYELILSALSDVTQPTHFGYSGYDDIFGVHRTAKHTLRLSADGKTLWGISGTKELLRLTRDEAAAGSPLDLSQSASRWRQACESGNRWRGRLTNVEMDQTTPVDLAISKALDADGYVEVTVSIPRQRKSSIRFRGQLTLDENHVNEFALVLQKLDEQQGQGDSLIFGKSTSGISLSFRMTYDGTGLIGMARRDGNAIELLELDKVK